MAKCKICKGRGFHKSNSDNMKGVCYYCGGTGQREKRYKRNKDAHNYTD